MPDGGLESQPASNRSTRCVALVPCAGTGSRAGAGIPKQYAVVAGRSVISHTLRALAQVARIETTLVVVAPDDEQAEAFIAASHDDVRIEPCGGATRAASVANGLEALAAQGARADDWVLVHDAARCLVRPGSIDRLIDACCGDAVGGLLALPCADTLKGEVDGRCSATLDRRRVWQAQTPQMFRLETLRTALDRHGATATDESSAIEALGLKPLLVHGSSDNFKLTWPSDFALADAILKARSTEALQSDSSSVLLP